jgi:hypothetical protein
VATYSLEEDPVMAAVNKNKSGATAKELFEDLIEELEMEYEKAKVGSGVVLVRGGSLLGELLGTCGWVGGWVGESRS